MEENLPVIYMEPLKCRKQTLDDLDHADQWSVDVLQPTCEQRFDRWNTLWVMSECTVRESVKDATLLDTQIEGVGPDMIGVSNSSSMVGDPIQLTIPLNFCGEPHSLKGQKKVSGSIG